MIALGLNSQEICSFRSFCLLYESILKLQFLVFVPLLCFFFPSNTPILYALLIDFLWLFSVITLLNSFLFVLSFLFDLTIFPPFWTSSFVFIHRYVTSSLSLVYVMIFFLLFLILLVTWFLIFSNFDLCYSLISCISVKNALASFSDGWLWCSCVLWSCLSCMHLLSEGRLFCSLLSLSSNLVIILCMWLIFMRNSFS